MAQHNEHKCLTCGKIYEYCRSCMLEPIKHFAEGFCSETCSEIFNILSKNGCGLAAAEETLKSLNPYDLTGLDGNIQAHINRLKAEVEPKVESKPRMTFKPKTETNIEVKTEEKSE